MQRTCRFYLHEWKPIRKNANRTGFNIAIVAIVFLACLYSNSCIPVIHIKMKQPTHDEHDCECDCHAFIGGSGKPCPSCRAEFEQGYAQAFEDVAKRYDKSRSAYQFWRWLKKKIKESK